MRLKKDFSLTKKNKKNISKNSFFFFFNQIRNLKYEIINEKNKDKAKNKKLNNYSQNIYNQNKNILNNQSMKITKGFYENINNNKLISLNNNISINLRKNTSNIINDENISNNIMKNNTINNNNMNTINIINYNKSKICDVLKLKRKNKGKNTSMEQRHKKLNKDISLKDDTLLNHNDDNSYITKNNIYYRLYNRNSPISTFIDSYRNQIINNDSKKEILSNDINNYNYTNENIKLFYNNFYEKINYNSNRNKNNITFFNEPQNTDNNFYKHKTPLNTIKSYNYLGCGKNKNNSPKKRGHLNSMIIEDKNQILSPFENYGNNNNYLSNDIKRRSKNKIKITKLRNPKIVEYKLNLSNENGGFEDSPKTKYNYMVHYNKDFTKGIKPDIINRFIIYGKNSKININERNNFFNIDTSIKKGNNLTNFEKNSKNIEKFLGTPNFSENGKTPKRYNIISCQKISSFNNKEKDNNKKIKNQNMDNIESIEIDNTSYKILVKKRPKNEITTISKDKRRNSTSNILFNNTKKINNKNIYKICSCQNININPINNNNDKEKLLFNNEDELIEYINKKYEEERKKKSYFNKKLRFTGFILTKKYKGKNLYDIRIEDDIDKINKQLKNEEVTIKNQDIELIFLEDKNKYINNQNELNKLNEENKKIKLEYENLIKKDITTNELIKKLNQENLSLMKQINKLSNEIKELQNINDKLIEENKNYKNIFNKKDLFKIENNSFFTINKIINNINKIDNILNTNKNVIINDENINVPMCNKIDLVKKGENYNNIISDDENRYIIGQIIINDNFGDNIFLQNQNHPKINDLVEEGMSDEELK